MPKFSLTPVEEGRAEAFRQYIKVEFGTRHYKRTYFQYIFTPNGIGVEVIIRDKESGEERDISDLESW